MRDWRIEETRPYVLAGSAEDVRAGLQALADEHGVREFVLDNPVADFATRLRSAELIAQAHAPVPA